MRRSNPLHDRTSLLPDSQTIERHILSSLAQPPLPIKKNLLNATSI